MTTENDKPTPTEGTEAGNGSAAPPSPTTSTPTPEAPPVETAEDRLARAERERDKLKDQLLRTAADFENFKRRTRREMDEAAHRGREALLRELLAVADNLDRALQAAGRGGTVEALAEGVRMVDKQFHNALEKFEVRRFDAYGQPFDPARHDAIQQIETEAVAPGSVAMVFARGYTIGERLLRPAMVAVAKAPPRSEPAPAPAPTTDAAGDSGDATAATDGEPA